MAKYIGETNENLVNGEAYSLSTKDMVGGLKDPELGIVQDQRIMAYINGPNQFYKVYSNAFELLKDWSIEGNYSHHSHRLQAELNRTLALK